MSYIVHHSPMKELLSLPKKKQKRGTPVGLTRDRFHVLFWLLHASYLSSQFLRYRNPKNNSNRIDASFFGHGFFLFRFIARNLCLLRGLSVRPFLSRLRHLCHSNFHLSPRMDLDSNLWRILSMQMHLHCTSYVQNSSEHVHHVQPMESCCYE